MCTLADATVIEELRASNDPLERDLAKVLQLWQSSKRDKGKAGRLGFEPRDIKKKGVIEVLSLRVRGAASGFYDVDPRQSYEALVLKYAERFEAEVVEAARQTTGFVDQDIKFLVKTRLSDLFGERNIPEKADSWIGRTVTLPTILSEHGSTKEHMTKNFRAFLWLHEHEHAGERGKGLTAVVLFSPTGAEREIRVMEVFIFERPVGADFFDLQHRDNDHVVSRILKNRHSRTWAITDNEVVDLFMSIREKSQQIAKYEKELHTQPAPDELENADDVKSIREIVLRRNQGIFRQQLLEARPNRCAISGTSDIAALEAAHIIPYSEGRKGRDLPENGFLLRADIHTLFDAHLISINPETREVELSANLGSQDYLILKGKRVADPVSEASLQYHFKLFKQLTSAKS